MAPIKINITQDELDKHDAVRKLLALRGDTDDGINKNPALSEHLVLLANKVSADAYALSKNSVCLELLDEASKLEFVSAIVDFNELFNEIVGVGIPIDDDKVLSGCLEELSRNLHGASIILSEYSISSKHFDEIGFGRVIRATNEIASLFAKCDNVLADFNTKH